MASFDGCCCVVRGELRGVESLSLKSSCITSFVVVVGSSFRLTSVTASRAPLRSQLKVVWMSARDLPLMGAVVALSTSRLSEF